MVSERDATKVQPRKVAQKSVLPKGVRKTLWVTSFSDPLFPDKWFRVVQGRRTHALSKSDDNKCDQEMCGSEKCVAQGLLKNPLGRMLL